MNHLAEEEARRQVPSPKKKAGRKKINMIIKITKAVSEAMLAFIGLWLLSGGLWMNGKFS